MKINVSLVKVIFCALLIIAHSLCLPSFAQVEIKSQDSSSNAALSFKKLKALAGTWKGIVTTVPYNPAINGKIQVRMYLASRGTVIMHEIAPSGMVEPTVIYLDSNRLTMIHYCEAGNRPRLIAASLKDPKITAFNFVEISGSKEPVYLTGFTFNVIAANHHTEDWTFSLADGSHLQAHFDLRRTKE